MADITTGVNEVAQSLGSFVYIYAIFFCVFMHLIGN